MVRTKLPSPVLNVANNYPARHFESTTDAEAFGLFAVVSLVVVLLGPWKPWIDLHFDRIVVGQVRCAVVVMRCDGPVEESTTVNLAAAVLRQRIEAHEDVETLVRVRVEAGLEVLRKGGIHPRTI